ncbi:MAG: signal peptidase I [Symploca sp. SIO2D2]|nr:signal peptidase I [Symploca sp. SIO2D2]
MKAPISSVLALLIVSLLISACGQQSTTRVSGYAMSPNYVEGDLVEVDFEAYKEQPIKRWEVVYVNDPKSGPNTKRTLRVVGLPGEVIKVSPFGLRINKERPNGLLLPHSHRIPRDETGFGANEAFKVPEGSYYLLGDNAASSRDSRHFGAVKAENVLGKVVTAPKQRADLKLSDFNK